MASSIAFALGLNPKTRTTIVGPNAAPKAVQANSTLSKIVAGTPNASITDSKHKTVITIRAMRTSRPGLKDERPMSCEAAAAAVNNNESTVDITADSNAAKAMPAKMGEN